MNSLPNAGVHLSNIDVRAVKVHLAVVKPPGHRCYSTTLGVEGEEVMTIILTGMKHLGPVPVVTQMIAFEPLSRQISSIIFDLALIYLVNMEMMGYWLRSKNVREFKVVEGVFWIISGIVL
jgi:hypothetical protein